MTLAPTKGNLRLPLSLTVDSFAESDALISARAVSVYSPIADVIALQANAQIAFSVVQRIAIDVVNYTLIATINTHQHSVHSDPALPSSPRVVASRSIAKRCPLAGYCEGVILGIYDSYLPLRQGNFAVRWIRGVHIGLASGVT